MTIEQQALALVTDTKPSDVDGLIERLRTNGYNAFDNVALHNEAATTLAAQQAENARLREDSDATLDALFDAIALIGQAMPMETTALIGGERLTAKSVWQKGHDIMFPRAALKEPS